MSRPFFFEGRIHMNKAGSDNATRARVPLATTQARVRLRTVALPTEHGGWGLALEPVALGLLVAPSVAGFCLAIATMGAFLARHPFKIVAGDRRRGRRFPRTAAAERFALFYGSVALAGLLAACATAADYQFIIPLLLAAPFAAIQLAFDASGRSRALAPELAGSFGLAAVSTGIALAAGWPLPAAFGLWALLAARVIPAILYVRARLTQLHGESAAVVPVILAHAAVLLISLLLAWINVTPLLAVAALSILLLRAAHGLASRDTNASAKQIGIREICFGALTVFAVAAGHLLSR